MNLDEWTQLNIREMGTLAHSHFKNIFRDEFCDDVFFRTKGNVLFIDDTPFYVKAVQFSDQFVWGLFDSETSDVLPICSASQNDKIAQFIIVEVFDYLAQRYFNKDK